MIQLEHIGKTYPMGEMSVPVLKDINLRINEGEYTAIMGPSGSGKSTLMNLIGCLDRPTIGQYYLDGQDISKADDMTLADLRNRRIGFVFQQFQLLPRMTAQKNVELPLIYAGVSQKERADRATEALEKVGLADRRNHRPTELSGGQQQRVAIARALVNNPVLILADEPTGALDTHSGKRVMSLFDKLHQEGRTVLLITHDPEVATHAQRQILIRDGKIVEDRIQEKGVGG